HELGQPGVYRDVQDPSVTIRFRISAEESFLAWTTTPWTLPSNFALAVHPDREYVRARVPVGASADGRHEIVWVVAERAQAVLPKEAEILERRPGSALVGKSYEPLFSAELPAVQ